MMPPLGRRRMRLSTQMIEGFMQDGAVIPSARCVHGWPPDALIVECQMDDARTYVELVIESAAWTILPPDADDIVVPEFISPP
jgi:hypothetical protein